MTAPPARRPKGRFDWERAIIGENGPRSATTRLVLLVLATHVACGKAHAWPSLRTLEAKTGLSNRSVIDQLEAAVAGGWLVREFVRLPGMRYRGNVYWLTFPACAEPRSPSAIAPSDERRSPRRTSYPPIAGTGEGGPATAEPDALTAKRPDGQLVNVVPRTTLFNRKENRLPDQEGFLTHKAGTAKTGKTAAQWALELGIVKGLGEHEGAFQARVSAEVTKHKAAISLPAEAAKRRSAFAESV